MSTVSTTGVVGRRPLWLHLAVGAVALVVLVLGLREVVTGVAGVAWSEVIGVVRTLTSTWFLALAAVWFGGLAVYATVLAAALPGLGMRRSLLLNLSGSAVANVLPLGGAVATALNWRMVRSWGHPDRRFAGFCVLTNGLDVASKLILPIAAVIALVVGPQRVPPAVWAVGAGCGVVLAVGALVVWRGRPGWRLLAETTAAFRERPVALVAGSIGYVAAQVLLLWLCLDASGLRVAVPVVLTGAALERLASLLPLTPGGAGFAEIGVTAWLVGSGLDPVASVTGVLLYRAFVVGMEIPVGAVLLGAWAWTRRTPVRAA